MRRRPLFPTMEGWSGATTSHQSRKPVVASWVHVLRVALWRQSTYEYWLGARSEFDA